MSEIESYPVNHIQSNLTLKKGRYHIGDLWWHSPEQKHIWLSNLKFNLPTILIKERASVLIAKRIAELKSDSKVANTLFKSMDFVVQNVLQQP